MLQPGREDFENLLAFWVSLRRFQRRSVDLTCRGDRLVTALTEAHLAELHNLAMAFDHVVAAGDRG